MRDGRIGRNWTARTAHAQWISQKQDPNQALPNNGVTARCIFSNKICAEYVALRTFNWSGIAGPAASRSVGVPSAWAPLNEKLMSVAPSRTAVISVSTGPLENLPA